jgi:hypothetical protein
MLVESSYRESELELAQTFLFGLSDILYQVEPYMETIGYERLFHFLDQGVIVYNIPDIKSMHNKNKMLEMAE